MRAKPIQIGLVWLLMLPLGSAYGISVDEVLRQLNARQEKLSQLEIEFRTAHYRTPGSAEPFDETRWIPLEQKVNDCINRIGTFRTWSMHSYWVEFKDDCPAEKDARHQIYSWHDGETHALNVSDPAKPTGQILPHQAAGSLMTERVLTPLGYQFFTGARSLPDLFSQIDACAKGSWGNDLITLSGEEMHGETRTEYRVTLDPAREYLPIEMYQKYNLADGKFIEYRMKVVASERFEGLSLPTHAVRSAYYPSGVDDYDIAEWRYLSVKRDSSINAQNIVVRFPSNTRVFDELHQQTWVMGANGKPHSVEKMERPKPDPDFARVSAEGARRAAEFRAAHGGGFPYLLSGGILVIAAAGVVIWLKSRGD